MGARIVIFGATGYTGELTARALVARGGTPVLAGRSRERLEALAASLGGLEVAVADVAAPASVRALVERGDVLVSTVGPFLRFGAPALHAAIDAGAHYFDSTGEAPFIRAVFEEHGARAATAGSALLTAFGADWVPGNLAGALALHEGGEKVARVAIAYFATGSGMTGDAMSGGTRASAAGVMLERGYTWRDGRLVSERNAARVASFEFAPGRRGAAVSTAASEHFALPRLSASLREVDVYLGWFGALSRPLQVLSLGMTGAAAIPGVRRGMRALTGRFVTGSTGGPSEEARGGTGTVVLAHAFDAAGTRLAQVRLEGVNPYTFTGAILAWGAEAAAAGAMKGTGALGPADAFGVGPLQAGVAEAGLTRS